MQQQDWRHLRKPLCRTAVLRRGSRSLQPGFLSTPSDLDWVLWMKSHLDGKCSLIPHLKWFYRVSHIFVERATNQILNCAIVLGITKLVWVSYSPREMLLRHTWQILRNSSLTAPVKACQTGFIESRNVFKATTWFMDCSVCWMLPSVFIMTS